MPRQYDDRDDYDELPYRRRTSPAVILLIVVSGASLLGIAFCAGLLAVTWVSAPQPAGPPVAVQVDEPAVKDAELVGGTRRVYTRQEFQDLVVGKTPDEVIAAVGKPDDSTEDGDGVRWTYAGRVRDPAPGKSAGNPVVVFRDGKAAEVRY
ncbi:MAG TPA: hypothetical protein VKD90_28760 [Gemmataceae bacterium]|nr:hypothetical protein [Gemmataceae bacterium]